MATLVLGTIGGLIGGPIGAALGAAIGNRVDQRLLAPKGRRGPRLNDLAVQGSSYGASIPKIFGTMRVSGSVIWSTDLIETRKKSGGKGKPKTTTFSYAASFAVALSARPIISIGRIWADGKLLRGAGGDFKTETGFRVLTGSEDQLPDAFITAAEGVGDTPAYRGIAYAVFEDFQLADYGNRIPSLSFEVIADAGDVSIGSIAQALAPALGDEAEALVSGFAASGDSVRGAIESLGAVLPMSLHDDGNRLTISDQPSLPLAIPARSLGATSGDKRVNTMSREQRSALQVPESLLLAYYDPARDFQAGTQSARRDGGARRAERVELAATLDAGRARSIVEARLTQLWSERLTAQIALGPASFAIRPGTFVTITDDEIVWQVRASNIENGAVTLSLMHASVGSVAAAGSPGRYLGEADLVHGPTTLAILDLPSIGGTPATAPQIVVAATGASAGWRRAALTVSRDGGASWQDAGQTAAPARMGSALGVLGVGPATLIDTVNSVDIQMINPASDLNDADMAALLRGDNLALLGDELIQFGRAVPIAAGQWRLSQLLRGRRGTDWAMAGHAAGDRFVMIEADSFAAIDAVPLAQLQVMATGIGDTVAVTANTVITGHALRPLSVVHLKAQRLANGDTQVSWIRRSRTGWSWPDSVDVALSEEAEAYRVDSVPDVGAARTSDMGAASFLYTAQDRAADTQAGASSVTFTIRQIGQHMLSLPVSLSVSTI
jgi:hypothetical protein